MKNSNVKKINVAGLIGYIISIILIVCTIVGMVAIGIVTVGALSISNNDINYGLNKIASIRKKENPNDYKYIFAADIEAVAETLGEKLTKEEIDEMLNEALQMGKLLNKDDKNFKETKEKDIEGEVQGEEGAKKLANAKKITLHDFRAILTWENK